MELVIVMDTLNGFDKRRYKIFTWRVEQRYDTTSVTKENKAADLIMVLPELDA